MVLPIGLLTIAALLIISGITNRSIAGVINGDPEPTPNDPNNYGGVGKGADSTTPTGGSIPGNPVIGGTSISPEHPTLGLIGYPAHDYFAQAGSTVVSPVTGVVTKLSGNSPSLGPVLGPHGPLGWSVYIKGGGHTYYLTHMGSRSVSVGQSVTQGQPIGTVADYAKYGTPSHIHMGVH